MLRVEQIYIYERNYLCWRLRMPGIVWMIWTVSWKEDGLGYVSMDFKSFYIQPTQGEVNDSDGQVKHRSDLGKLLGISSTSMDFDMSSVEGEAQLQPYMQVQQVPNDVETASARVSRLGPNG